MCVLEYEAFSDILTNTLLAQKANSEDQDMEEEISIQQMYQGMDYLNFDLPFMAVRSLKVLTAGSGECSYIISTFSDGRTLTICLDHHKATKMVKPDQTLEYVCRKQADSSDNSCLSDY